MKVHAWIGPILIVLGACATPQESSDTATEVLSRQLSETQLHDAATTRFFPLPADAPNPDNPVTTAKVELGRILYFDTRLSKNGTISCDSCHSLASFGVDNLPTSPGDTGEFGDRNSPTVLNAALHIAQFWDGRAADVEEQAGMPILNPVEMAIPSEQFLVERLAGVEEYRERFARAFPDEQPSLTYGNIARALAAFERTLLTPAPFDDYLNGDLDALAIDQKAGLELFMMHGCAACHNGYAVGGYSFRKFGLTDEYWVHTGSEKVDEGRFVETEQPEDRYVFKVAALRNVEKTGPYFHDGAVADLEAAVRIMGRAQLGRDFSDVEASRITAFLESLTGELPEGAATGVARP